MMMPKAHSAWQIACLAISFIGIGLAATSVTPGPQTRTRLHDGWKFSRFEEIPDNITYDLRGDANSSSLHVLKPWILPSANEFIKDPSQHYPIPSSQPDVDIEYVKKSFDDSDWQSVTVPHDWAIKLPFLNGSNPITPNSMGDLPIYGVGYYRRSLDITSDDLKNKLYLDIDAAMSYTMVWVNEQLVGGWPYGYNSFRLDITPYLVKGAENYLAIRVDNPRGSSSRWYSGAGVYRNVWLTKVNPVHVAHFGTFITSSNVSSEEATLDLAVQIENNGQQSQEVTIDTEVYEFNAAASQLGKKIAQFPQQTINIPGNNTIQQINSTLIVQQPRLWGPYPSQTPNLYMAVTNIQSGTSQLNTYNTEFGIRSITYDPNNGLLVNNERVYIQGVNQHHDLGALGAAFNIRAAARQLEILKGFGVNAIRTSHNPPAPELLQLADQMGFLIFAEIFDCWVKGKTPYDFHLIFPDWSEADLRAFIRRDRNHPSIYVWSYGNEVGEQGDPVQGPKIASYLRAIANDEDPTRKTTFSENSAGPTANITNTAEIVSLNYQGDGMRYGPAYEYLTDGAHKPPAFGNFHDAQPGKMIQESEMASSLSLRGSFVFPVTPFNSAPVNDTSGGDPTTLAVSAYELYTAEFGSSPDRVFLTEDEYPFAAGGFVWSGFDYLGEPYWCNTCRSGYWGIVDLAGFKKERAWLYQARWRPDLPMAHIVPHWNWPTREGLVTPVHVFSAADEAELFINDKSQGRLTKQPSEYRFRWDNVTYSPGSVHVLTYKDGKPWANDSVRTSGEPAKLKLIPDRSTIASDGEDLSFITVQITDQYGLVVPDANNTVLLSVSGSGVLVATDNGFPNDRTPFTSATRAAFNGHCLGIVSGEAGRPGSITVKVESEGLASAEIQLQAKNS